MSSSSTISYEDNLYNQKLKKELALRLRLMYGACSDAHPREGVTTASNIISPAHQSHNELHDENRLLCEEIERLDKLLALRCAQEMSERDTRYINPYPDEFYCQT